MKRIGLVAALGGLLASPAAAAPLFHAPTAADCTVARGGVVYNSNAPGGDVIACASNWVLTDRTIYTETNRTRDADGPKIVRPGEAQVFFTSSARPRAQRTPDALGAASAGYDLAGAPFTGVGPVVVHVLTPVKRDTGVRIWRGAPGGAKGDD